MADKGLVAPRFLAPGIDEQLACSQCEQPVDVLAQIPLHEFMRGWRAILGKSKQDPWIGLCETCVRKMLDGFPVARKKIATGDVAKDNDQ